MLASRLAPKNPRPMTLLIVDREPSVRSELAQLCLRATDVHVIGEAESGGEAIDAAESLSPDVMLIDVALPDMSGFDVLRGAGNLRALGIMIAHRPDFAERAMAEGAVDYLLKPVSADRFEHAIGRVRQRYMLEQAAQAQLTRGMLELMGRRPKILVGERQHRLYPLNIEKIDYIESAGNYVTIRAGNTGIHQPGYHQASDGGPRRLWFRADRPLNSIEYSGGRVRGARGSRNTGLHAFLWNVPALQ